MKGFGKVCLGLAMLAMAMFGASAQGLSDPTRPPTATAADGVAVASAQATQLQSVLISPNRRVAVINGTSVPLGGKFGEATLVRVTETEVELRTGGEKQVLTLLPGIDKTPVKRRMRSGGREK